MKFESMMLLVIAIIFAMSMVAETINPGSEVFHVCKFTLPMMATAIIGFVFGRYK